MSIASNEPPEPSIYSHELAAVVEQRDTLLAACKAVAGVFEGQEDMPIYARKCTAAIAKVEGRIY